MTIVFYPRDFVAALLVVAPAVLVFAFHLAGYWPIAGACMSLALLWPRRAERCGCFECALGGECEDAYLDRIERRGAGLETPVGRGRPIDGDTPVASGSAPGAAGTPLDRARGRAGESPGWEPTPSRSSESDSRPGLGCAL